MKLKVFKYGMKISTPIQRRRRRCKRNEFFKRKSYEDERDEKEEKNLSIFWKITLVFDDLCQFYIC
ncbi:hypothetical protein MTR67_038935 [Solanum verrucosum]|uniref:Uncharacterized protein n=1 Tax=Solanum verrucosum TaxID=315347 RepID=A0AAF0UG10_SOLVR|nr:hypothetical protein MTR67_038935 [Solanum verrucosum]